MSSLEYDEIRERNFKILDAQQEAWHYLLFGEYEKAKANAKTAAKVKATETKPKGKSPSVERKTTSIFSKIKKLASKKSK